MSGHFVPQSFDRVGVIKQTSLD